MFPVYITKPEQFDMTLKAISLARECTKLEYELIIVETVSQYFSSGLADIYIHEKDRHESRGVRSMNRAFRLASGENLTMFTTDVFVRPGWLEAIEECLELKDCGAATLATSQFRHTPQDKIEEGNWWSIATIPTKVWAEVGEFDERYKGVWSDTDYLMRLYESGRKMYRNFKVVVDHLIGATEYEEKGHKEAYSFGQELFRNKFEGSKLPIYGELR